jgi:hypothetical protein
MHEFDKCHFCSQYDETDDWCSDMFCDRNTHSDYILDVHKIFKKADDLKINISDVIALMNEVNK